MPRSPMYPPASAPAVPSRRFIHIMCPGPAMTRTSDHPITSAAAPAATIELKPPPPGDPEVSFVMPCLNEAEPLGACIRAAQGCIAENVLAAEIIVADNGSTDGSQDIARRLGARVVPVARRGYGAALMGGIEAARGRYVIMGDADMSYDFGEGMRFVEKLREGNDLVMGSR